MKTTAMDEAQKVGTLIKWRGETWVSDGIAYAPRHGSGTRCQELVRVTNARGVCDLIPSDTFRLGGAKVLDCDGGLP